MGGRHSADAQQLDSFQRWEEMTASNRDREVTLPSSPLVPVKDLNIWAKASCKIILAPSSWGSGFFVKFRIHENKVLRGLMTNNHVLNESNLEDEQNVQLCLHNDVTITVQLKNVGIRFTCPLLDVTFIELKEDDVKLTKDHHVEFLQLCSSLQATPRGTPIAIMQYPKENQNIPEQKYAQGSVYALWGTSILHNASTSYGSSGSGIVSTGSGEVVAIHCARHSDKKVNVGVRAPVVIQAIEKVINVDIAHHKPAKDLNHHELKELNKLGLRSKNKFLFFGPSRLFVTPLWFYRTNHAWYWTPTRPGSYDEIELVRRCNWHEIGDGKSKIVIDGDSNGNTPGSRQTELIDKIAATGLDYLVKIHVS